IAAASVPAASGMSTVVTAPAGTFTLSTPSGATGPSAPTRLTFARAVCSPGLARTSSDPAGRSTPLTRVVAAGPDVAGRIWGPALPLSTMLADTAPRST